MLTLTAQPRSVHIPHTKRNNGIHLIPCFSTLSPPFLHFFQERSHWVTTTGRRRPSLEASVHLSGRPSSEMINLERNLYECFLSRSVPTATSQLSVSSPTPRRAARLAMPIRRSFSISWRCCHVFPEAGGEATPLSLPRVHNLNALLSSGGCRRGTDLRNTQMSQYPFDLMRICDQRTPSPILTHHKPSPRPPQATMCRGRC